MINQAGKNGQRMYYKNDVREISNKNQSGFKYESE